MKKKNVMLLMVATFLIGLLASSFWYRLNYPMKPLFVEIVNNTETLIPSVIIEHGKIGLQEKISIVQLRPKEKRRIALNHNPGLGFNVKVNYPDGETTEVCAGKNKDYWFFRETITKIGIYTTPIR